MRDHDGLHCCCRRRGCGRARGDRRGFLVPVLGVSLGNTLRHALRNLWVWVGERDHEEVGIDRDADRQPALQLVFGEGQRFRRDRKHCPRRCDPLLGSHHKGLQGAAGRRCRVDDDLRLRLEHRCQHRRQDRRARGCGRSHQQDPAPLREEDPRPRTALAQGEPPMTRDSFAWWLTAGCSTDFALPVVFDHVRTSFTAESAMRANMRSAEPR